MPRARVIQSSLVFVFAFATAFAVGACKKGTESPESGTPCGDGGDVCGPGEVCCNPSCGICVEEGGACTPGGPTIVRFGDGQRFLYAETDRPLTCDRASFGGSDPAPGQRKRCEALQR